MTFIEAIAHLEGFYATGPKPNRPQRCNNPGDLNYMSYMEKYGATLETIPAGVNEKPRFAHFPTPEAGFAALHDLLAGPHYADLTVEEAINRYAPPSENATMDYVSFVCGKVGCNSTDIVRTLL